MTDISLCVICLRTDKILRTVEQALFNFHDELCDFSLSMDRQAQYCLECEWKLRKFRKFKQTCIRADKILQTLQRTGPSNNKIFYQKQLTPPTLDRWDGHNSKTYYYIYVDEKTPQNPTNKGYSVLYPTSATTNYDYKIRVKNFSSPQTANAPMKRTVQLLNPTTKSDLNAKNTLPATGVKKIIAKSMDDILCVDSIDPLVDVHKPISVERLDDSDEDSVATLGFGVNDDDKDNVPILIDNIVTDTVDPLGVDEDDKDDVPLLEDNDVANATGITDPVSSKDLHEQVGPIDFDNIISTHAVKKSATYINKNIDTHGADKMTPEAKKISVCTERNKILNYGLQINPDQLPNFELNITTNTQNKPKTALVANDKNAHGADKMAPEASNEVSIYTEPTKILNYRLRIQPDQLPNIELKGTMNTQNNKENEHIVLTQIKQYHGPKHLPQVNKIDGKTLIKEEHCYTNDDTTSTTTESIHLRNIFLDDTNISGNANSNISGNVNENISGNVNENISGNANSNVKNPAIANINQNNNKQTYDTTFKSLQKLTAKEIDKLCKMNTKIKKIPIKRLPGVPGTNLKKVTHMQLVRDGLFIQIENGKIVCRKTKGGKVVGSHKKKKKVEKAKKVVKKDVIKKPTLSKEEKEYLNLLSFVKLDKNKPKKEPVADTEMSEVSKRESEEGCSNNIKSQQRVKSEKENLTKTTCLEQKLDEEDISPYSHDNPFPYYKEAETKLDLSVSKIEQEEKKVQIAPRKTLTELTNVDILSDDQEVKVMYVFNKEKYGLLSENDTDTNVLQSQEEIVEFGPDAVANEEIIQYYEVIQQNGDKSEMVIETSNSMQASANGEANKADETIQRETEQNEDVTGETEQYEEETENLSSKFEGTLMERKVFLKLRKKFKLQGEIKTADGNVISKEALLNFYGNMENEDKWQVAKAIAGKCKLINPESAKILWKLQQKYENEYASIFDIEFLNTEEKVRNEFMQRMTYSNYVNATFKCELCIKPFENQKSLDYHNKWHDPSYGDYVCDLCQTRYKSKVRLYTHRQLHTAVYRCKLCPLITHRKQVMISHFMHHKGYRTLCQICGQTYRNGSSYNQHMMLHSKDHECNMCARNFASPLGLKAHKRLKHENTDLMQSPDRTRCDLCDIVYISQEVYLKHYRNVHDPTAPKVRTVRALGAQWRPNKGHSTDKTPTKKLFTTTRSTTKLPIKYRMPEGRYSSQTFAAATRAIQIARYNNMLRESNETEAKEHQDAENSIDEQDMTLVYENDEDISNGMSEKLAFVYDEGNAESSMDVNEEIVQTYEEVDEESNMHTQEEIVQTYEEFDEESNMNTQEEIVETYEEVDDENNINTQEEIVHTYQVIDANSKLNIQEQIVETYEEVDAVEMDINEEIVETYEEVNAGSNIDGNEEIVEKYAEVDAGSNIDVNEEIIYSYVDPDAARESKRESTPSYEDVTRAITAKRKTMVRRAYEEITLVHNGESDGNVERDLPQHFAAITNASRRSANIGREITQSFDSVADTGDSPSVTQSIQSEVHGNTARTKGRLRHTVDANTHTITVSNRNPGLDMPQLGDSTSHDADASGSKLATHNPASGRNYKGGKRRSIPQVYDTMSRHSTAINTTMKGGKRKPKEHEIPQVYSTTAETSAESNMRVHEARDGSESRYIKGGKRKPDMPQMYGTMADIDAGNSMVLRHETQDDGVNIRKNKGGKRKPDMPQVYGTLADIDAECSMESGTREAMNYDADASSNVAVKSRNVHVKKKKPHTLQESKRKSISQDMIQTYEVAYDSDASSSRTIEAMTMHLANSQKKDGADLSQPSPEKKRKKVNVEMNPTYGYVYSTYHP